MKKVLFIFFCFSISFCLADNTPQPSKAADLIVNEAKKYHLNGDIFSISPDGKYIFVHYSFGGIKVWLTSTFEGVFSSDWKTKIDDQNIAWSPDSSKIAFTENASKFLDESDIWILDIGNRKLANLTDDGIDKNFLTSDHNEEIMLDTSPVWLPDNETIIFARNIFSDKRETCLYRMNVNDGIPEKIMTTNEQNVLTILWSMHIINDGKQIVYAARHTLKDENTSGIWIADLDGNNIRRVIRRSEKMGNPFLVDVSDNTDKAIILYAEKIDELQFNTSYCKLLDLSTGQTTPLKQFPSKEPNIFGPIKASFSPDGSKILYYYQNYTTSKWILAARDTAGTEENILHQFDWIIEYPNSLLKPFWSDNNVIYIISPHFQTRMWVLSLTECFRYLKNQIIFSRNSK